MNLAETPLRSAAGTADPAAAPSPTDAAAERSASAAPAAPAVADPFGDAEGGKRWRQVLVWTLAGLLLLAASGGVYTWRSHRAAAQTGAYVTTPVKRGNLVLNVTANGTLQPTRAVNIGSELSGTVSRVLVDINDQVRKGQVLVELDTAKLNDQIVRSRAALAAARAAVAVAQATQSEARTALARLEEVARLSDGKVPSRAEMDTGRATLARADANVLNAKAAVDSAQAALSTDMTNLARASIRAPIDGVVLSRSVDPGNAVAASLQAVTLFQLAEDLHHLRLLVNVDEADVGAVRLGQTAMFTVSAYANRPYPATITRVAYGSTITDNVVTYVAYLDVDNADLTLRPGMTATATIRAAQRDHVLLIPNSALRFAPRDGGKAGSGGIVASLMPRLPARAPRQAGVANGGGQTQRQVWVLRGDTPQAITVQLGISDGRNTEVSGDAIQEGMQVITDQRAAAQ
ncbi:efflux RND transporter periplasmic adaptor subunit [Duganella sp. LX20W]|uniref:Efflux RND transporter periplasmic adaptor subunit n=1 Tax=Rugamonas brunnea TaxID=2758569 RepID=A0A7W2ICQ9_9BURK|nr:efflux RND transporter periplasmic adaptor subunit [Rugamonas brunnea]MBA5638801.1 efflux RND transporter periplasmic adaptor subunit [Rugamonas brunnea]